MYEERRKTIANYLSCEDDIPDAAAQSVLISWLVVVVVVVFVFIIALRQAGLGGADLADLFILPILLPLDKGLVPRYIPVGVDDNIVLVKGQGHVSDIRKVSAKVRTTSC
jgi:hypothetical protein